ncbi:unnamed protein product [Trifolium pratense]|uniref:Uncharacterized protein n=1 Tax=Trifolium pratense TaxID=57577 RepID=A0ACB0LHX4_TRIPR|nr:unnamed protein product [Trifolium pratense]
MGRHGGGSWHVFGMVEERQGEGGSERGWRGGVGVEASVEGVGEGDAGECQTLLFTISLQDHVSDRWQWQSDLDDGYTVRGSYQILTTQDAVTLDVASGLIWHRQVPLKVSIKANLVTLAGQVTYQSKPGYSRDLI